MKEGKEGNKANHEQQEMMEMLREMNLIPKEPTGPTGPKDHTFWNTQPVPQIANATQETTDMSSGEIVSKELISVRTTNYNMPPGFEWSDLNLTLKEAQLELYTLLNENYVEDDDNCFRFDYSMEFLQWALTPPDFEPSWHVGVRNINNGKLVAFISGIPATIRIETQVKMMAEINFLCIHKKLRTKRLAPVLIKEITRRVNLKNIWQAVYTAGVVLPLPITQCRYYHRSINPKKLIDVGFSKLQKNTTMTRTIKMYSLPDTVSTPGFRIMEAKDVPQVALLLSSYLESFKLVPIFTKEDTGHWILPRDGVINSYVVEDPISGKITDLCSFYRLPSSIIGHVKHKTLKAAYSFYNFATSVPLTDLMQDCCIKARDEGFDVFNALDVMDNKQFLSPLKFGMGDGDLHYYLYNWRCPAIQPADVGIVLC